MMEDFIIDMHIRTSREIAPGKEYKLYLHYCTACKEYKRLTAGAVAAPGGTLSCPICRARKENGPFIEGSYGRMKSKPIPIVLGEDVEVW